VRLSKTVGVLELFGPTPSGANIHVGMWVDFFALHKNPAGCHTRFAGDDSAERGFPGAVGPIKRPEIVVIDTERVDIERLETVGRDVLVKIDDVLIDGIVEINLRFFRARRRCSSASLHHRQRGRRQEPAVLV